MIRQNWKNNVSVLVSGRIRAAIERTAVVVRIRFDLTPIVTSPLQGLFQLGDRTGGCAVCACVCMRPQEMS